MKAPNHRHHEINIGKEPLCIDASRGKEIKGDKQYEKEYLHAEYGKGGEERHESNQSRRESPQEGAFQKPFEAVGNSVP